MWPVHDVREVCSTLSVVLQRTPNHAVHTLGCEHCAGASQADLCVSCVLMQAARRLIVQQLIVQHLSIQQLTAQQLTAQQLTAQQLTVQHLSIRQLRAQHLSIQPLRAQQLTVQQLMAAVPTGMEHQAPVLC